MNAPPRISPIERTLRQHVIGSYRRSFSEPPHQIVVGFSGGTDSLALALLLRGLGPLIDAPVTLLHIDHQMQNNSTANAHAAVALADHLSLPISIETADRHPVDSFPGVGPEEAARRVRYQAFSDAVRNEDCVALAHQADDQSETVLLHLMRGSGSDGLAGMRERSELVVPWWTDDESFRLLTIWRPLLGIRRSALEGLVAAHGLNPVEDATNADLTFRRNDIRLRLLPLMREIEPSIDERLGTLARIMADERDWTNAMIAIDVVPLLFEPGIARSYVRTNPPAVQRKVIRAWCLARTGHKLSFERVEAIRSLAVNTNHAARIELGDHIVAWIDRDYVYIEIPDAE